MRKTLVAAIAVAAVMAFGSAVAVPFSASAGDATKACAKIKDKAAKEECMKQAKGK